MMNTADLWVHAIFATEDESGKDNSVGDAGRALGPGQMHPEFFWDFAAMPHPGWTWREWFTDTARRFYNICSRRDTDPLLLAMRYHLGHWSKQSEPDWDEEYAERFVRNWASVRP